MFCCAAAIALILPGIAFGQPVTSGLLGEGQLWQTPFYVTDSGVDGPTVIVTGGIHGNEPAGAIAAQQIRHWSIVRGTLIVIPQVNVLGLQANTRYLPDAHQDVRDLNRNFPTAEDGSAPRGDIAEAVWQFVTDKNPDWLFDLHEGYAFNISHKPAAGKKKSVGSSIIFDKAQGMDALVERMQEAANQLVDDDNRRFVRLGGGPIRSSLARATIDVLGKRAMIVETTYKHQRLPVRTRQHRAMMNVALRQVGIIDQDLSDVMTPPRDAPDDRLWVALYDDEGGSERGVSTLSPLLKSAAEMSVVHLDARDLRKDVLSQFDAIVFGGGSGSRQAKTIGADGAAAVSQFVRNGGGYVGICGGAYLCSAHYKWSLNLIDTHVFTGSRDVEGVGVRQMWRRGGPSMVKMQLTDEGRRVFGDMPQRVDIRYQNGPIVSPRNFPELTPFKTLAWFRSEKVLYPPQKGTMVNTPAIVEGRFGEGRVISISPHPESTPGLQKMIELAVKSVARKQPALQDSVTSN